MSYWIFVTYGKFFIFKLKVLQKVVIGIGAGNNYTLYDVGTDNTQFVQAGYKSEKRIKGFGRL